MPREPGRPRRRRLAILGLVLMVLPSSGTHEERSACPGGIVLTCVPVQLVRILPSLARFLLADVRSAR